MVHWPSSGVCPTARAATSNVKNRRRIPLILHQSESPDCYRKIVRPLRGGGQHRWSTESWFPAGGSHESRSLRVVSSNSNPGSNRLRHRARDRRSVEGGQRRDGASGGCPVWG